MRFLIDGNETSLMPAADRGLAYGDGVFRTFRVRHGEALHWGLQYERLASDCRALALEPPAHDLLARELLRLGGDQPEAVGKIVVTRGAGTRGYDPSGACGPTRLVAVAPMPRIPAAHAREGVRIRVCRLRLSAQPRLAGVKHLNRLENVLARAEWADADVAEGLMLDAGGRVIEGTMSNLFVVRGGALFTPDLSASGVAGVQRGRILGRAAALGIDAHVAELTLADVLASDEAFLVNSVIGLWPVRRLDEREWPVVGPVTRRIAADLFDDMV